GTTSSSPSTSGRGRRKLVATLTTSAGDGKPDGEGSGTDGARHTPARATSRLAGVARRDGAVALGAAALALGALDGVLGWLVGGVAGYLVWRWMRRRSTAGKTSGSAEDRLAEAQLPLTADLLAACLAAGSGPREAAEAVGNSLGGPLGERLARAA